MVGLLYIGQQPVGENCLSTQHKGGHKLLFPLLTINPNQFTKNKEGKEADLPLHVAVFEGHTEAAKELVRLNAGQYLHFLFLISNRP